MAAPACVRLRKHVISRLRPHAREEYRARPHHARDARTMPTQWLLPVGEQTGLYSGQTSLYGIPPVPLIQTGLSIYFLGGHMRI